MDGQTIVWTPAGPMSPEDAIAFGQTGEIGKAVTPAATPAEVMTRQPLVLKNLPVGSAIPMGGGFVVAPDKPLRPRDVVKAAKARAREIRAELRNKARLERELAELERLIAAAKRPVAAVRPIESARQSR